MPKLNTESKSALHRHSNSLSSFLPVNNCSRTPEPPPRPPLRCSAHSDATDLSQKNSPARSFFASARFHPPTHTHTYTLSLPSSPAYLQSWRHSSFERKQKIFFSDQKGKEIRPICFNLTQTLSLRLTRLSPHTIEIVVLRSLCPTPLKVR
jgi:hypothetical protein